MRSMLSARNFAEQWSQQDRLYMVTHIAQGTQNCHSSFQMSAE